MNFTYNYFTIKFLLNKTNYSFDYIRLLLSLIIYYKALILNKSNIWFNLKLKILFT